MILYHGTSAYAANLLASSLQTLSVALGGGELGQGFYAGDHVALAAAWAQGRSPYPKVLEIDLDVQAYVQLSILTLNWVQVVNVWNQLKSSKMSRTFQFNYDVVHGPLATYQHATQHKFESTRAEVTLQAAKWRVL